VTSLIRSTNHVDTDKTGFRCIGLDYETVQFDWCCKSKNTSGGIPYCPDVMSDGENELIGKETQCPDFGCPIHLVKTYYDQNAAKINETCKVSDE
jgi:hypothetical protein